MKDFIPDGDLEIALLKAKSGFMAVPDLLRLFMDARVVIPSAAKIETNGAGFQPLEFTKEKVQMLGCFTTSQRIGEFVSRAPFYIEMTGKQLLERLPPQYGVVVNPGWTAGFDIPPQGIKEILTDFTS